MGTHEAVRRAVVKTLKDLESSGDLADGSSSVHFSVDEVADPERGDVATNAAFLVARASGRDPAGVARQIADRLGHCDLVRSVEPAGGFVNFRLQDQAYRSILNEILDAGAGYGRAPAGTGKRILLEFVSANPTGPLLISHGRGAVLGDAIGRILEAAGHKVVREYYVNDRGKQVKNLVTSVLAARFGGNVPKDGYSGDYVQEIGRSVTAINEVDCVRAVMNGVPGSKILPGIRNTLTYLGVSHDSFISERALDGEWRLFEAVQALRDAGAVEDVDDKVVFKSSALGDDKDRVLSRIDPDSGVQEYTYFAGDVAYHIHKAERRFDRLVTLLGADHHGYVARVRAAMKTLGLDPEPEVVLFQLVNLIRDGNVCRMGKRLGNLITIEEVCEEVDESMGRKGAGADVLRYFYLSRSASKSVDLDIDLAKRADVDNPVFYLQMGHARLCSIQRKAESMGHRTDFSDPDDRPDLSLLGRDELLVAGFAGQLPSRVREAAKTMTTTGLMQFLDGLSRRFQSYFTRMKTEGDPILADGADRRKVEARLAWVQAVKTAYRAGLDVVGISAPERLERVQEEA